MRNFKCTKHFCSRLIERNISCDEAAEVLQSGKRIFHLADNSVEYVNREIHLISNNYRLITIYRENSQNSSPKVTVEGRMARIRYNKKKEQLRTSGNLKILARKSFQYTDAA